MKSLIKALLPESFRTSLYPLRERVRVLLASGSAVERPLCGKTYREFLPHGRPERRNALC